MDKVRKADNLEALCRDLAIAEGHDPNERVAYKGARTMPRWCLYRERAREVRARESAKAAVIEARVMGQPEEYANAPLTVYGEHEEQTITQMETCLKVGNVVAAVICADGHLGYAQPVGGVIAYEDQISISGVGFDIACGNMAVRLDTRYDDIKDRAHTILSDIRSQISFGVGLSNDEKPEHALFDDDEAWAASGMEDYRQKARSQLGTVGSGNHYVDLFSDGEFVWIGVHFGSRGLGHTTATRYLKLAGGKDGIHVPPAVVDVSSDIGERYLAGMNLAGRYAYAGREWVVEKVRSIIGGSVTKTVHNHHNYAWKEKHFGSDLWVVRKGATPAMPGQEGFVGGSMGENAVIIEGVDSVASQKALYSTVHGAGRTMGRMAAKRTFTKQQMEEWLQKAGVILSGGDLDESPMAYKRLNEVLDYHAGTIKINHTLKPFAVAMAGEGDFDPWKD
jgi:tRNA-splicing ligase RtcB (3'-phosphate/5'-hydroxy nucleic acid ligase)